MTAIMQFFPYFHLHFIDVWPSMPTPRIGQIIPMCNGFVEHRAHRAPRFTRDRALARIAGAAAMLAGIGAALPLRAQEQDPDARAAEMMEQARAYYGLGQPFQSCASAADPDEIVVCGYRRREARYAPLAPIQKDIKMIALGAPPVGGGVGAGVSVRGCFLQKCPKPLYFIDLRAIPEPAPGTDADLIAKGLAR